MQIAQPLPPRAMMRVGRAVFVVLALAAGSTGLLLPTGKAQAQPQALAAHQFATQADVQALRTKLATVVAGFDGVLKNQAESSPPEAGSAKAKAWADVRAFVGEMKEALVEKSESGPQHFWQNPALAMEKLQAFKAEVPKFMALALGLPVPETKSETEAEASPKPTRADVESMRSSFANATSSFQVTQIDVDNLRSKLEKASFGLQGVLGSKLTALTKAHVEAEVKSLDEELHGVLVETKAMSPADALPKLESIEALVHIATSDFLAKQEELMKEREAQKESLLLSVLMTLQWAPMDQQLSALRSDDFAELAVCTALLEKHADDKPLFQQATEFLDGKIPTATLRKLVSNATAHHQRVAETQADIALFEARVASMAQDMEDKSKAHARRSEQLVDAVKRASGSTLPIMQKIAQREEESFEKFSASQLHDIKVMQDAVVALKQNDIEAAIEAVDTLVSPMKDMRDKLESLRSAKKADFVLLGQLKGSSA